MSGHRAKKLRSVFEMKFGFTAFDSKTELYRKEWKRFKRNVLSERRK